MQPGNQISPVLILDHTNLHTLKYCLNSVLILSFHLRLGLGTYLINVRHVHKVHRSLYYSGWTISDGL